MKVNNNNKMINKSQEDEEDKMDKEEDLVVAQDSIERVATEKAVTEKVALEKVVTEKVALEKEEIQDLVEKEANIEIEIIPIDNNNKLQNNPNRIELQLFIVLNDFYFHLHFKNISRFVFA